MSVDYSPDSTNNPQEDPFTEDVEDPKAENLVTTDEEGFEAPEFPTDDDEPSNSENIDDVEVRTLLEHEKRGSSPKSNGSSDSDDDDGEYDFNMVAGEDDDDDYSDDDDMDLNYIKAPHKELIGDSDLDGYEESSPDDLRSTQSLSSIHISKLEIFSEAEARAIAEEVIEVLEDDVTLYLETAGISIDEWMSSEHEEIDKTPRTKISGSSISVSSDISETLPGNPSTLRLHYEKGKAALREVPIPRLKETGVDEGCEIILHRSRKWHRTGGRPDRIDISAQTKEMTFVPEAKAQLIFMEMYPKPDDWQPDELPSRQQSMQACVDVAVQEDPNVDRSRMGPQVINFTNRKKLLQPLRDDYYKDETFWTGSRFRGEYKNRQFYKGHYDHPTGIQYESEWNDGHFHTTKHLGIMRYPRGDSFEGKWRNGRHISGEITFGDGLKYQSENWSYCEPPDRRLRIEKYYGMKPAGNTIYNDTYPSPTLPPGHYDVGDGIFNPNTGDVRGYDGFLLRNARTEEREWIVKNCRRAATPDEDYVPTFHTDRIPGSYAEQIMKFSMAKRKYH